VRQLRLIAVVVLVAFVSARPVAAQSLTLSLFEQNLNSLREQAAIPGLSAAIVQGDAIAWEKGFGKKDLGTSEPSTELTPYPIGGLSQILSATVLLKKCVDEGYLAPSEPVIKWDPTFPDASTTISNLLSHQAAGGTFRYDLGRFAPLANVIDNCAGAPYRRVLATEILDRMAMQSSVPGQALAQPTSADLALFDPSTLNQYTAAVRQMATPYRIDSSGRATRADYVPQPLDAASGVISTAHDLANFDRALNHQGLLTPSVLTAMMSNVNGLPTGFGWFVQNYKGVLLVWQFGMIKDAYSSLIVRVPSKDMTFILLANSDRLSSPFALENGDVTTSLFAKLFVRLATGQ